VKRKQFLVSNRIPEDSLLDPREVHFDDVFKAPNFEIGVDVEHKIGNDLIGKGIVIFSDSDDDALKSQR
ncbi:MAG: hypothetical protein GTO60_04305, partial [Gammaproteobacteria bacterium]|nr:hypothetical protein [Gammaproteobacteria bacterium]